MKIRPAKISDLMEIMAITQACARAMQAQGIFQWNGHYPDLGTFERDLERRELHVSEKNGTVLGAVVVSTFMDPEYRPITWLTPNGNSSFVHRLCVHPGHQGQGLARGLMDFAEGLSRERGYGSVRLDTFSQNKRNQAFYEQRGYQRLGDIHFPKQSIHPFHCYELLL